jgi:hypothetical protein
MAYEIVKNVPAGFPALTQPTPNSEVLAVQINAAITSAQCVGVIQDPGICKLQFDVQPSAGDLTAINTVCSTHTGVGFTRGVQTLFSEAVQTEPGTTYVQKAALQSGILLGGNYLVNWYCEIAVTAADSTSGVLARAMWGGTERAESSNNLAFYASFNGSVIVPVAALATPSLAIELRRVGTTNTAQIRRIRFSIAPLLG